MNYNLDTIIKVDESLCITYGSCARACYEVEAYNRLTSTEDRVEGTLAWNEKCKPLFKGR